MNPMHQLTRRPVKAAFGALLLALAGVILALSGGQFWAAAWTRAGVEATYTTVAVVTGRISSDEVLTPSAEGGSNAESLRQDSAMAAAIFLAEPEQQNWSIIRSRPRVGLVSGYSPGLKPAISLYTGHRGSDAPYEYSIVEIRADAVTERNNDWFGESGSANWQLDGQVLGIYGLNDAFRDPSGQRASVSLHQEYDDPAELLHPEAGKRYLLLSHSYTDDEWYLRRNVADWVFMETNVQLDPWSLDILGNLIRYDQRANPDGTKYCRLAHDGEFTDDADGFVELAPDELIYSDPVTGVEVMNVDPDDFGRFSFAVDALKDTGEIMVEDPQQPGNWRPETVDYTQYNLPSIQELPDGVTAQEVIDSTSSWRMAMESIQTNNHSVPVLAVDSVEGMLEFASGRTQITQGRSISQDEYRDGAAVCLIKNLMGLLFGSMTGGVGELSNFILSCLLVVPAGIIAKKTTHTIKHVVLACLVGAAAMALVGIFTNYFIVYPLYTALMPMEVIISMYQAIWSGADSLLKCLVVFNMPFTLAKGLIAVLISVPLYRKLRPVFNGSFRKVI